MKLCRLAGAADKLLFAASRKTSKVWKRRERNLGHSHLLSTSWLVAMAAMFGLALWEASPLPGFVTTSVAYPAVAELIPPSEEEVRMLAATTWAEARSEGEDGMRAVAHVIVNRVGPRFGEDVETVVLKPWQFSAWNRGDPNRPLAQNPERYAQAGMNRESWETAQKVAREVLEGRSVDPTSGALFYHTRAVRPYWASYGVGRQVIGQHVFYSDVAPRRS